MRIGFVSGDPAVGCLADSGNATHGTAAVAAISSVFADGRHACYCCSAPDDALASSS